MRTQSIDTHPEAERVQIAIMRGFTPARKFALVAGWMDFLGDANQAFQRGPAQRVAAMYGDDWRTRYQRFIRKHPELGESAELGDLRLAVLAACNALERRKIPYAIAGRLACSIYGLHSAITSIEMVVQHPRHLRLSPIHTRHQDAYLDVTHLLRVDITRTTSPIDQAVPQTLIEGSPPLWMLTPEMVTSDLLVRFAATGQRDDALYNDILGMVKVQAPNMNLAKLLVPNLDHKLVAQLLDDAGVK